MFRDSAPGSGRAVLACWLLAVVGLVALSEAASVEVSVWRLLASTAGTRLWRVGLLLLATGVTAWMAVRRRSGGPAVVLGILVTASMIAHTLAGHAGASTSTRWFNLSMH